MLALAAGATHPISLPFSLETFLLFGNRRLTQPSTWVIAALGLTMLAPIAVAIPIWLHTTFIGCIWGGLVLTGLQCAWSSHRLRSGATAMATFVLARHSLSQLTDLQPNACWMVGLLVLAGGWGLGLLLARSTREQGSCPMLALSRSNIFTLWDIGCLMTLVAVALWLGPRIENRLDFLCQLGPAVLGGWILSALAVQWADRDRWTVSGLIGVGMLALSALGVCLLMSPGNLDIHRLILWMLVGPVSVMTAQAMTVLVYLSATRLSMH